MAERKILQDPVHVRAPEELRVAQPATALRILALKQMAAASATVDYFPGARDLEPLAH